MKSPARLLLEALARRRPRYALQVAGPRLGVCGVRLRLPPTSPLFSGGGGEVLELPLDQVIAPVVLDRGQWQTEEVEFIAAHAPKRPAILFDIGANVGLVTRHLLHRLPGIEAAICFEPHPVNFLYLERNLAHLRQCRLVQAALGTSDGEATFYEDVRNAGNYSLSSNAMLSSEFRTCTVKSMRVSDERLLAHVPQALADLPIIWKSDTQGFDEIIMTRLSDAFWNRVHVGVMEILRIDRSPHDRARFAEIMKRFDVRHFSDKPEANVSVAEVLDYGAGRGGETRDLFFARA